MARFFAALAIGAGVALALSLVIGGFAFIAGIVAFAIACTLLLKPSPRPPHDDAPMAGPAIASMVLGAATASLSEHTAFETEREAAERRSQAVGGAAGMAVDAAGTAVELGAAYVGNVIDFLSDD